MARPTIDDLIDDQGNLEAFAWPGGYAIAYSDRDDSILCPECASRSLVDPDEVPAFRPANWFIIDAGESEVCDQCGASIE